MSNIYLETLIKELEGIDPKNLERVDPGYALVALTVELQTLNNTLKELKKEVNEINMGLPID